MNNFFSRGDLLAYVNSKLAAGALTEVVEVVRAHLANDPVFPEGRFKLATALGRLDLFKEAEVELQWLLEREPNRKSVLFALGKTKRELGQIEEAAGLFERALAQDPTDVTTLAEVGTCYLGLNRTLDAIETFRKAVKLAPHLGRLHFLLGTALGAFDQLDESLSFLILANRIDPRDEEFAIELVKQSLAVAEVDMANQAAKRALGFHPKSVDLLCLLANSETRLGNVNHAEEAYQVAIQIDPRAVNYYAEWLQEEGRFDEAADLLGDLIRQDPCRGQSYYHLAYSKRSELEGRKLLDAVEEIRGKPDLDQQSRMFLSYSAGLLLERDQDYEHSMLAYDEANRLANSIYNSGRPFDRNAETHRTNRMLAQFPSRFKEREVERSKLVKPILIVGMFRSGTTLLDQTLSSHPLVSSAGELIFWARVIEKYKPGADLPGPDELDQIAREYETRLNLGGQTPWVIDKMPTNYRYLGLARLVYPDLKVVHIRRSPLDTCLSIYTNHFGLSTRWAYDQGNIVFGYRDYLKFMQHWRTILPPKNLIEIEYESLIQDRESTLRRVLEFCEAPWDDGCLRHDANKASIRTPSRWQARQPIYKSSSGRWRHFESYLGDLLELRSLEEST